LIVKVISTEDQSEGLGKKIVEVIKVNNIELIEGSEKIHAEMKIINKLEEKSEGYIGLTKLVCTPCKIAVDIFKEKGCKLEICGFHGGTYPG